MQHEAGPYWPDVAVRGEDYTEAARLRDRLTALKGSSAAGVTAGYSGFGNNTPIPVYRFPRRALTVCPQLCMSIQPCARFPERSADTLPATLYGHFTQAIYRNRPISPGPT